LYKEPINKSLDEKEERLKHERENVLELRAERKGDEENSAVASRQLHECFQVSR